MPVFTPPTVDDVPQVPAVRDPRYPWHPLAYRARRYYGPNPRGRSVLKLGGTYQTIDTPTTDQVNEATEAYIGGHIYDVSFDVATALEAAGYFVIILPEPITTEIGLALLTESGSRLVTEGSSGIGGYAGGYAEGY